MAALYPTFISLFWSIVVSSGCLLADRAYLRRRSPYGRERMWNHVTLALALSSLFVPAPWTLGAHVWVTRRGAWPWRALLALLAATVGSALWLGLSVLTAALFGLPLD